MRKIILPLIFAVSMHFVNTAVAKTVYLAPGDNYIDNGLNIICTDRESSVYEPIVLTECQFWDDFNKDCLFEKTKFSAGDLECVEECQHWDNFNKKCKYQTSCNFDKNNNIFIQTTCLEFDNFTGKCVRNKESVVK